MKKGYEQLPQDLTHTIFINRENDIRHTTYDEEMLQYEYLKEGDSRAVQCCYDMFHSAKLGHLSDDSLRNIQYLFICFTTLATRFVIEGGLELETAYNISDLYIQKVDKCHSVEEVYKLHADLVHQYLDLMASVKSKSAISKSVVECIDYIFYHLHETIRLNDLAKEVELNPSYLSKLFKTEIGISISDFIQNKKIEAARNMLQYSDYSYIEIANYLAFNSQSYFITVFKKSTGMTPKEYRRKYFRVSF
jgi:YesN/AraC family two-component response regulator